MDVNEMGWEDVDCIHVAGRLGIPHSVTFARRTACRSSCKVSVSFVRF
jgi:hypothetical protein